MTMSVRPDSPPAAQPNWLGRFIRRLVFYAGYVLFGTLGTATSLVCLLPALCLGADRTRLVGQRFIHFLFRFFVGWLRVFGLMQIDVAALAPVRESQGLILVANHPSLLDVVLVVAQLPRVFCLMKANLAHNLVLCGQARLAGYVNNKSGAGLIKACVAQLRSGSNLLVFPEGTRSRGKLGPFKMGFALLARATQAPVQTILIRCNSNFLGKGWPFFDVPPLPIVCSLRLGRRFEPSPEMDPRAFGQAVEDYLRAVTDAPETSAATSTEPGTATACATPPTPDATGPNTCYAKP